MSKEHLQAIKNFKGNGEMTCTYGGMLPQPLPVPSRQISKRPIFKETNLSHLHITIVNCQKRKNGVGNMSLSLQFKLQ